MAALSGENLGKTHIKVISGNPNANQGDRDGCVENLPILESRKKGWSCVITVVIFYRSLTDLPKNFLIITENIFFIKLITD